MTSEITLSQVLRNWVEIFMHRSFRDFKRFMDGTGLSPSQVGTMMRLYHCGETGISEIAENLGITVAAASQLVDRLVQQGYLERSEASKDRRFKQVTLTSAGRELVRSGIEARLKWMEQLTEKFSPEDQRTLSEALLLLTEAARRLEPEFVE
jgi:DNA-binding MarR family transcriptional regulator